MTKSKQQLISTTKSMAANKKTGTGCHSLQKKKRKAVAIHLFLIYFVVLFYFLFFSEKMGRTFSERTYHYNLVPFREIKRFLTYYKVLGVETVMLNIAGNIAAFIPFGIFLPIFSKRCRYFWYTAFYSLELSLFVELLQLITKVGSFDVDDLLLNTIGGMFGYLIYQLFMMFWTKRMKEEEKTD